MFSIRDFKSNGLVHGGAKPSLFFVYMTPPAALNLDPVSSKKFTFSCRSASLPPFIVGEIRIPFMGRTIKVAGDREFEDWNVTVSNDEDFAVRGMFEKWNNAINRLESNVRDAAIDLEAYKVDMLIEQYSKDGEVIRSYELIGAFPPVIGPIELGWETTNEIETFQVRFAYDYLLPVVESSSKKHGGVNPYGDEATSEN